MNGDDLDDVLADLMAREPLFHRTELGTSREDFEASTADDFWEVGASGAVYEREFIWSVLEQRYATHEPDEWRTSDAAVRRLAADVYLVTYLLEQGPRRTRRASVWERTERGWRVIYHQGTAAAS